MVTGTGGVASLFLYHPYLGKSSHNLQTGVSVLTLNVLASADIPASESLSIVFNQLSWTLGSKVEWFPLLEKKELQWQSTTLWLHHQIIYIRACEKHVGEDFWGVCSCTLKCLWWRLGTVTETFQGWRGQWETWSPSHWSNLPGKSYCRQILGKKPVLRKQQVWLGKKQRQLVKPLIPCCVLLDCGISRVTQVRPSESGPVFCKCLCLNLNAFLQIKDKCHWKWWNTGGVSSHLHYRSNLAGEGFVLGKLGTS